MSAGSSITEIISYFAGYFQTFEEASRSRLEYNEMLARRFSEDYDPTHLRQADPHHKVAPFDTDPTQAVYHSVLPDLPYTFIHGVLANGPEVGVPPLDPLAAFNAGINGASPPVISPGVPLPPVIKITYGESENEIVLDSGQINTLFDNDTVEMKEDSGAGGLNAADNAAIAEELAALAGAEIPAELVPHSFASQEIVKFFSEYNAAWSEEDDPHGVLIEKGDYVNGVLQDEDAELPELPEPVEKEYDNHQAGQIATLGDNLAQNGAVIADVNMTMGTLFVGGDYFRTDAIVQTNVYSDEDDVTYGGGGNGAVKTHDNDAHNLASFYQTGTGFDDIELEEGENFFSGMDWYVEVMEGDFFNVHSMQQENWMIDNDVVVQGTHQSHYQMLAGGNEQGNFIDFLALTATYDLVVVMGDYHEANMIFQTNLLWDNDVAKVVGVADGADGAEGGAVSTGGNWLINDAIIEHVGNQEKGELTEDWQSLIQSLSGRAGEIDPQNGVGLPNFDDQPFNVLFITGNMYDISVITQLNFMLDADTALQYLPGDFKAPEDGFIQELSTGGNVLSNFAAIVKPGAIAGTYVGGDTYEDEMLLQAEIVISDDDEIVYGDPDELASELVAFTGQDGGTDERDDVDANYYAEANDGDVLGNLLS